MPDLDRIRLLIDFRFDPEYGGFVEALMVAAGIDSPTTLVESALTELGRKHKLKAPVRRIRERGRPKAK